MNRNNLKMIDYWIAAWGIIAISSAVVISGKTVFLSALLGSLLGLINWIMFRYAALRMAVASNKTEFGIFMGIKSLLIMAIITALFLSTPIRPVPFIAGISSLFLGIITFFLMQFMKKGDQILNKENENA